MRRSISGSTALTVSLFMASVLIAAGCGLASGSSEGSGSGGEPTLSITSPSDGDRVELPFTVRVSTSEELGPEVSGKNHWHLYFDGEEAEYQVITSDSAKVDDLPPGKHTIKAALQHADHSPVGPEDEIGVTIAGGAGGGAREGGADGTDGHSLYDY